MQIKSLLVASFASVCLGACQEAAPSAPQVRQVRTIAVEQRAVSEPVILTGQVQIQDEVNLAFRIDGRLIERRAGVGDKIPVGHLVARLDQQNELNALRSAEADVAAARAALAQAEKLEARQKELLGRSITTRANYDQSLQQLQTSQAQLDSAEARLAMAKSRVEDTHLYADVRGTITAKAAEPGEFVRAGQMIVRIAAEDRRDAIFDVPGQLMRAKGAPRDPIVEVALADNPQVKTTGRIREIAAQPDPVTRTFAVKVGLIAPPEELHTGATVTGTIMLTSPPVMTIPGTALLEVSGKPSVWVVHPRDHTVALRAIEIARYDASAVIVSKGLDEGEVVVTAGVHVLHPGQKVRLLPGSS
jgi:RND family efflux transporter MFP subunit